LECNKNIFPHAEICMYKWQRPALLGTNKCVLGIVHVVRVSDNAITDHFVFISYLIAIVNPTRGAGESE
jgi:hypothetical protein